MPRKRVSSSRRTTTIADDIIEFASHLKVPEGSKVGQPLVLLDWQRDWIRRTFAPGVRRSILSVARRNGKTGLIAVIVLAALIGPLAIPQSRLISASRSREQAGIVFDYARKMLALSGLLHLVHIREAAKEIVVPSTGVMYRAVSADATTALGFGARLVVHDELGTVRGPRDALYEAISTGLGSYSDSLELIISTQAPSANDLMSVLLDDAMSGRDPAHVGMLFAAPDDCRVDDETAWHAANPSLASGIRDLSDLKRQADEARQLPAREASFRNLLLNQRIDAVARWITPSLWRACNQPVEDDPFESGPVYGGLDLSSRSDLTALVLVAQDGAGVWHVRTRVWTPADTLIERARRDRAPYDIWRDEGHLVAIPGAALDYDELARQVVEATDGMNVVAIAYDRWRITEFRRSLDRLGVDLPLSECGQGFRDMSPAVELVEQLVLQRRLRHGDCPPLTSAVLHAVVQRDPAGNRKIAKDKSTERVDAAVALAMAVRQAHVTEEATTGSATDIVFA